MYLRSLLIACLLTTGLLLATAPAEAQSGDCDGPYVDMLVMVCGYGHESCGTGYVTAGVVLVGGCVQDWSNGGSSCSTGYVMPAACVAGYSNCELGHVLDVCAAGYERQEGRFEPARSCGIGAVDNSAYTPQYTCVASEEQAGCYLGYHKNYSGTICLLPNEPVDKDLRFR